MAMPFNDEMINKNLFTLGMDSYGFVELITDVESEFAITFDEQDLVSLQMQTVSDLMQLIDKNKSK